MDLSRHLISLIFLVFILATFFSTALTRHRIRHHRDRFKRQQGAHLYLPGSYVLSGGTGPEQEAGPWTDWGSPSDCSRTCGGGVATQIRQCHYEGACRGPDKKHFSCNTQDCPDNDDYRAQQCSEYDRQPFEGVYYQWIPYTKAPNPCELNCMPRGERFYYRHKKQVADGTRCNADSLDVCVDGTCQSVGCDMMLGSHAREDKCRQCGGNGTTCQTLSGVLDNQDLSVGYNDILLIPAGATNIEIRERQPSNNYLAVRNMTGHYYLNGNWRIDFPKTLRFASCNFHYERSPQGFAAPDHITCLGPIYEPLFIVLLYQDTNVGVNYEYSIPKAISSEPETYSWIYDEFSPCTASCGGGYQTRNVSCAGRRSLGIVDRSLCDPSNEPPSRQLCGDGPCEPQWIPGRWNECSEACGENGVQTRDIQCARLISTGVTTVVNEQYCIQRGLEKPEAVQDCNRGTPCPIWFTSPWKPCDHLCGQGKEIREVTCYRKVDGNIEILSESYCESKEPKPEAEKTCNLRPCEGVDWVTSEWSGCDKCGLDSETRKAHCATQKGEVYSDELCEGESKPELVRKCDKSKLCETQWYASQWSECSANCGPGVQTRNVFCGTFEGDTLKKLNDELCDDKNKYDSLMNCTAEEEVCAGEWFSGPWSKCDKECGSGTKSRKVICMKEEEVIPVTNCDANIIPFTNEQCNEKPCGDDEIIPVDATKSVEEKDESKGTDISRTTAGLKTTEGPEWDPDQDIEIFGDDECLDGEWVDVDDDEDIEEVDEFEDLARLVEESTPGGSSVSTESSSLFSDDDGLMLSDSTYSTDESGDTSPSDEGSGDMTSPIDASTSSDLTSGSSDTTTIEGSGESDTTGVSSSDLTTQVGETGETSPSGTEESGATTEAGTDQTGTSDASVTDTSEVSVTDTSEVSVTDTPGITESESTDSSASSGSPQSTVSSGSTDSATTDSSGASDVTEASTDSSASSGASSDVSESITSIESSDSTTSGETTPTSDDTTPTSEETSPSSESTSESTPFTTETSIFTETSTIEVTETSDLTTATSDVTTATSDVTTETSDVTTESVSDTPPPPPPEESDFGIETEKPESSVSETETSDITGSDVTTESGSSDTTSASDVTTVSGDTETTVITESGPTEETDTTVSGASDATTASGETEVTVTTESGPTEESTVSGSTETTESSGTETTESGGTETTESGGTETSESTVSAETTESGPTESTLSTESSATEETSSSESTVDIWTTESSFSTEEGSSWGTTPYTIEAITAKARRKCVRRKQPACKSSPFGCCYDLITPAQGPFDKGCPTPKTCNDTKFGCCPDNVSPATGPKNRGCPKTDCKDTLFGCCPDNETPAEGNDNEGCIKEPKCLKSKYGCCADNTTKAQGPDRKGCKECGKFGCCPDGITKATGKNNKGCDEVTTIKTPEDCAKSKFGCCPNGQTAAEGEHFMGCDIINKDNCTASYYGCCPDGVSPAHGPEYQGCRMACEDEQYGCCPDRVTAAHGPNQEGCCLVHPYGCCPDNILPARGPNLEGCGCQYSPYGCCPDNITAARGRGNEGCGCEHTEHGCCPDRYTPAAGPDNQGCACHTFQFGCCPDGVTVSKGPRKQGCDCRNTEFGCCSDEQTPAQGPNFAGCECASSKYGCCPDGVSDSQGENFDGCDNVPPNKQEVCSLVKDRGTCNNYTVKWFFDMEYGGCSRFWYGGCEGNANRFMNMEECKNICIEPQGKEICQLPKVTGACEGYYPSWYYDKDRKQCAQFIWGGCLGNANRFETREDCQALCHVDRDQDACEQPREEGPCRGSYRRWYFNKENNICEQFVYGGCKPNNNNFQTEMACKQQCLQPGRKKDLCALPRAQGNCTQKEPRWYFDGSENRCMPFYYSGCDGNKNRFNSREACEVDCPTDVERDTCILPALAGECHDYTERWYYDTNEKRCRLFYYGGCGGNDNNFATEPACLQRCNQPVTTPAPQQSQFQREHCFLPSEVGPCRSQTTRWYYDSRDGVCKQFVYGGCQGNPNNFESKEECHHRCGTAQDLCDLPMIVGPCNSDYLQFFYDNQTDTCQMFNYGGCQGNDNRFNDQESCERRCRKSQEPVTYPPVDQVHTDRPYYPEQHLSSEGQICYSPADVGNCTGNEPAYYYNAASQKCEAFVYTGCGGNANRFISEEQCQRHCGSFRGLDVCSHPKDTGNCKTPIDKWYYDHETRRCQQFQYGGCGGSGNRFSFIEECESVCVKLIEPPPSTHNDTSESHGAICLLPVEVGPCEGQYHHPRWRFDDDRRNCVSFIYSGCGGNQNNFRSYQQCIEFCHIELGRTGPQNEIDVEQAPPKSPCEEYRDECSSLLCPYGTEGFVDVEECNRCRCYEPCRDTVCPDGTLCAIDLNPNASLLPNQVNFIAACRPTNKDGVCPHVSGRHDCAQECRSDADCSGEFKCCPTNCGTTCVYPYIPGQYVTDSPAFTDAPHISGGDPPVILDQNSDNELTAEEGSYVLLRCHAQGNPHPTITWRRGHDIIDGSQPRQRILLDGSLQLVGLDKGDKGIYSCTAENGIGYPARKDVKLDITDPTPHPANVVGDEDTKITVTLGAPHYLRCFAYGWPRPTVTWWRGDSMLPFSSEAYEQKRDYTLLIRSVKLQNLGVYTCQAYNGLGKAASWSLTVYSLGPVLSSDPEDEQYKKFLVSPQDRPTTPRPVWPFRPTRLQPRPTPPRIQVPVPTPEAHIPAPYTDPNPEIVPEVRPEQPRVYTVPVRTNITLNRNVFAVDSDISIPCDVDGHPVPRVHWYKNRVPLELSDKIQISESHRLTIARATTEDSGEYLCEAENEFSKSSSSVKISVEGIYIHPNCTDNPFFANCGLIVQANYCTHKYYARFCCKSCTQAGQLPSYGPHLATDSRQTARSQNYL